MRDDAASSVGESPRLDEFFRSVVDHVTDSKGFDASLTSRTYLVGLLSDYARPSRVKRQLLKSPLTFRLAEALEAAGAERFERMRLLGDEALYLSGFFSDHLSNRGIELSFASDLGAVAYDSAANVLIRGEQIAGAPQLFRELAQNFDMFVQLLNLVADRVSAQAVRNERGVLELYERWLKSGSNVLSEALVELGVLPVRGDDTIH